MPTSAAASSLDHPPAIASQNPTRCSRRAVDGRPGDHTFPRITRTAACRSCLYMVSNHLQVEVLRRPHDFAQYTAIRYAERLTDAKALASIGTVGNSFDNAMAESVIGLYKTECVRREGPWRGVDDLELATLNWVWWFNQTRLHSQLEGPPSRVRDQLAQSEHQYDAQWPSADPGSSVWHHGPGTTRPPRRSHAVTTHPPPNPGRFNM